MMPRGLHFRLALIITIGAIMTASLASIGLYQWVYQRSIKETNSSISQLLNTVRITAGIAAYVPNEELASQVLDGLLGNESVVGAILHGSDGLRVTAGDTIAEDQAIGLALEDPFSPGKYIGRLAVLPDPTWIAHRANDAARFAIAILLSFTVLIAFIVWTVIYFMLTRPLVKISNDLHKTEPGGDDRLPLADAHRESEFGRLVNDINTLLDTVQGQLSDERALRERVESLEQRFRGIFEGTRAGIFLLHRDGRLLTANPAFFGVVGAAEEQLTSGTAGSISRMFARPEAVDGLLRQIVETKSSESADLRLARDRNGEETWVHVMFSVSHRGEQQMLIEGVLYDISERRQREENARRLAEIDSLTGLPNRHTADQVLHRAINLARHTGVEMAVMFIDLDNFKEINDAYSHEAGDTVLRHVATRLQHAVRNSDTVARLGGDEFLILLPGIHSLDIIRRIGNNVIRALSVDIEILPGRNARIGASIGVAICPRHGTDSDSLRKHADAAMYAVKRAGRNGLAIYSPEGQHSIEIGTQ